MNSNQFVSSLVEHVHVSAVEDVVAHLEKPSGRKPAERSIALAKWYAELDEADRANLRSVIEHSVHATLFGVLCTIDGVRPVHEGFADHEFLLHSVEQGVSTRLNNPEAEDLHDIYQGFVYPRVFG